MRADSAPASVQPDEAPACDISVVIPTRNRPTKSDRCLGCAIKIKRSITTDSK